MHPILQYIVVLFYHCIVVFVRQERIRGSGTVVVDAIDLIKYLKCCLSGLYPLV